MNEPLTTTRYNHRIPHMRARTSSGLRLGWLSSTLLAIIFRAVVFLPCPMFASALADAARQLGHKIAAESGPGAFALEIANRSSLDEKSVREMRAALEAELHAQGVNPVKSEQAIGNIAVVLSESLREYVWTSVIAIGSDEKKIAMVSLPRPPAAALFAATLPMVLKATLLFAQEQAMLDVALADMPGGSRLLVLDADAVAIYRRQGLESAAHWDREASLSIPHSRTFPRDLRGRLLLRRDHLFDIYLPGTICRSASNGVGTLSLVCNDSNDLTYNDPWPLTAEDGGVRAFFAASRNFFTGALSPPIGKISNVPSFYSAAALPHSGYTLWAFAAVDGSLHMVDGMTDQFIPGAKWGSDLAAIHSACGSGAQLLVTESEDLSSTNSGRDGLRAIEIPDRDPVPVSSAVEFEGQIAALWPETSGTDAMAIVKRKDAERYEAYRISISCGN